MDYEDKSSSKEAPRAAGAPSTIALTLDIAARTLGIVLILAGSWTGIQLVGSAWELYDDPDTLERFTLAIERGSNIDKLLAAPDSARTSPSSENAHFRPSYFLSWFIVLVLLMVVAKIAIWIIRIGGELALAQLGHKSSRP